MADVFISYCREDKNLIKSLVGHLKALKLEIWYDLQTKTGAAWEKEVATQLGAASCVLVCWSPESIKSDWVKEEAREGHARNALLAVRIGGGASLKYPMPFGAVQTNDLENWSGDYGNDDWRKLVEGIGRLCQRPDLMSWGKLDADTPSADLGKWLKQYPNSPLVAEVRVQLEKRHKIEFDEAAENEKRAAELAQERRLAAERLAAASQQKEEEERAAREKEELAQQAVRQLENTRRKLAESRARDSETERLILEERLRADNEAADNRRQMAEQARKSAARAEQAEREMKAAIEAMQRAEKAERQLRLELEARTQRQREEKRQEAARIATIPDRLDDGYHDRETGGTSPLVRLFGVGVVVLGLVAVLFMTWAPARAVARNALDALPFGQRTQTTSPEEPTQQGSEVMYAGADGANVRAAPGDRRVLVRVTPGTPLTVLARAEAGEYTWFRVELASGQIGYVREDVVSTEPSQAAVQPFAASRTFVAGAEGANVRSAPQMGASIYVFLDPGAPLDVTGRITIAGQTWYRVRFGGGREGFVRDDVVERASSVVARSAVVQVSATPPAQPQLAVEPFTPRMPLVAGLDGANVRQRPATSAAVVLRVSAGDPLQVTGRVRQDNRIWYRVVLRDGRVGFVREDVTAVASPAAVRTAPRTIDPRTVTWLRRPSRADMLRVYPRGAFTRRQEGSVDLECLVRADGRLENCTVVRPDSIAVFSDAALRLVGEFRMDAQLGDATNAAGRRVRVTVDFRVAN